MQHLITLKDWSPARVQRVLELARRVKKDPTAYMDEMDRKTLIMIFEKPSLRTRVSFETGFCQMGGHAIYYDLSTSPLGAGKESICDMIKVLSRYVDMVMARLFKHEHIEEMARHASVPVINALTDHAHPCQVLADLMTIQEHKGSLSNLTLAYVGDGRNNVTHSLVYGCALTGMNVRVASPPSEEFLPSDEVIAEARETASVTGASIEVFTDPFTAVEGADVVYTDSWMSYHIPKEEMDRRVAALKPFQVNAELMARANKGAIFMNCLPAMREYEQTAEVIDGPQSVVFDEAENRLHAQKAVMIDLMVE